MIGVTCWPATTIEEMLGEGEVVPVGGGVVGVVVVVSDGQGSFQFRATILGQR